MKLLIILLSCTSMAFITISTISAQDNLLEIENNMSSYTIVNKKMPITENIEFKKRQLLEERENVILLKSVNKIKNHPIHLELNKLLLQETSNNKTTIIMVILFIGGILLFFGYIKHWKTKIKKEKNSKDKDIKKTS